uniref:Uncharacterized protein n=1 Tax=Moschus moschiferus TaxID=68415 RepID=A0A8C6E5H8_MOSMO
MISVSTQLFLVLFSLLLVLPVVEAVEAEDAIALLLGVILSITGICACLGVTELWCLKVPKKQLIEKFHIIGYFPIKRNKLIYCVKRKTTCFCHNR